MLIQIQLSASGTFEETSDQNDENGEKRWKVEFPTHLVVKSQHDGSLQETAQNYCDRLTGILRKFGGDSNSVIGNIYGHLKWLPTENEKGTIRLYGELLGLLKELCGDDLQLTLKGFLQPNGYDYYDYGHHYQEFKISTAAMIIVMPSSMNDNDDASDKIPGEGGPVKVAFCEDLEVKISNLLTDLWQGSQFAAALTFHGNISFDVEDNYINYDESVEDKLSINKKILQESIHSDLSIVAANNSVLTCHKSYLVAHSPVFEMMLGGDYVEAESNRIQLVDVSESCVKAILEYVYYWDITKAVKCSKLAVELFQVAHKYDIHSLEKKLAAMFLQRSNQWFDSDAALDLFCFARKIGTKYDELKLNTVKVLKSKGESLMQSESYAKLFKEDWKAAMELCAVALTK